MNFIELETNRLYLRKIDKTYANDLFNYLSKDSVTRYLGKSSLQNIEEAHNLINMLEIKNEGKRGIRWGIILKESEKLIGSIGYDRICVKNRKADIGYDLDYDYWNMGIAKEAMDKVLEFGFYNMNLNRVGAVVFLENESSYKLLRKFGFKKEGILREYVIQNNKGNDTISFSLLKNEFKNNNIEI